MVAPRRTLAVCGPTAAGKSDLSIHLAHALGGEVVNVDSVQVYRGLDIGSAKLSLNEREGVPHHVLDIFAPDEVANVAKFRREAILAIDEILERGNVPILVGGSGLYLTALLHGLAEVPPTPPNLRLAVAALSLEEQYAELLRVDPRTANRLSPNDRQRVSRAIEIFRVTGRPASEFFAEHTFASVDVTALALVICRPRDELYHRIDRRAQQMVDAGLLAETTDLLLQHGRVAPLKTLGYKQACDCLQGVLPKENVVSEIALHTRRFAKRQMTYWRNEPTKRGWVTRPGEDEDADDVSGFSSSPVRAQKRMKGFRVLPWDRNQLIDQVRARLVKPLERSEVWFVGNV
jgi:tRNA dimethylallyltransferase